MAQIADLSASVDALKVVAGQLQIDAQSLDASVQALIAKPSAGIDPAQLDPIKSSVDGLNVGLAGVASALEALKAAVDVAVAK